MIDQDPVTRVEPIEEEVPPVRGHSIVVWFGMLVVLGAIILLVLWSPWFALIMAPAAVLALFSTQRLARRYEMWHRMYGRPLERVGALTYLRHLSSWFFALLFLLPLLALGAVALVAAMAIVFIVGVIALIAGAFGRR